MLCDSKFYLWILYILQILSTNTESVKLFPSVTNIIILSFLYFLQKLFATNVKYLSNVQISLLWITNKFYKPFAFIATLFFSVLSRRILTKSLVVKLLQNIEKLYEEHYYNFLKIDKFPMRIEKIYSLSNSPCIVSRERHSERLSREITPL